MLVRATSEKRLLKLDTAGQLIASTRNGLITVQILVISTRSESHLISECKDESHFRRPISSTTHVYMNTWAFPVPTK